MRMFRFALVGALLLGASACQTDDGGAVEANIPPLAFVRYVNAVPDTFNLTVRWVDQLDFSPMTFVNVPFRGMGQGGYQGLEAGSRHFRVFTYDPALSGGNGNAVTAQLADTTFDFVAGQYYTILHQGYARVGQTPAQRVYILQDALPATSTSVALRAIHAAPGVGALDIYATAAQATSLVGATPTFANVAYNTTSAYATRAAGAFSLQAAATGATFSSLGGSTAPAGVAGTAAADPIAGSTVGGSVLTAIAFPGRPAGSPQAAFSVSEASGRSIDTIFAVAGGYQVTDLATGSYATNRFVAAGNSTWSLVITPAACAAATAPTTAKCETRPATNTSTIIGNTQNTVTTAASLAAFPRAYYFDTLKTPVGTARTMDTAYAVAGGWEIRDLTPVPWTAGAFVPRVDTTWIATITPPACPTAAAGQSIVCQTRPAARIARLTNNGTNTLVTASDLTNYARAYYTDSLFVTGNPVPVSVTVTRSTFTVTRDVHVRSARSTYAINGSNVPSIVWISDRQPPRTTSP